MKKELWLEFGFLQKEYKDMCWYNEGRWQELPYFLKNLWKPRVIPRIAHLVKDNKTASYIIKRKKLIK